ncbi:GntR family transcriptional regulator [Vibrio sp. ZSDZ65]|uniref:GntR family transcriptional regulator n=1 Tax=Vibrio qingdaonensis TaxID=2829491 RepID=A0A9X3CL64_9VIBR|nr:GntR family transcriptional regulator [Vibrio qingdaonensis]MCW8345422.1 GntR family transcriptional regulator [Vibrio qingdaonensis]
MKTSKHKAMAYLTRDILNQSIAPNERLVIQELSNRYGLGLSPIREATQELASLGFIDYQPNIGAYVTPLTALELRSLIQFLISHFRDFGNSVAFQEKERSSIDRLTTQHAEVIFHCMQLRNELNKNERHNLNVIIIEDHLVALLSLLRNQRVAAVVDVFFGSVMTNLRRYIRLYLMYYPTHCVQLIPIHIMENIMVTFTQDNHADCSELVAQYLCDMQDILLPALPWDADAGVSKPSETEHSTVFV